MTVTSRLFSLLNIFTTGHNAVVVVVLVVSGGGSGTELVELDVLLVVGAAVVLVVAGSVVVVLVVTGIVDVVLAAVVVVVPLEAMTIFRYAVKSSWSVVSRDAMFWYSLAGPSCCFRMSMPLFRSLARLPFASVVTSMAASQSLPAGTEPEENTLLS